MAKAEDIDNSNGFEMGEPYYCKECKRNHTKGKIYKDHLNFASFENSDNEDKTDSLINEDYDDEDEIPEEIYDREDCIEIPHKNDLDLGKTLVFEFVDKYLPNDFERIRRIFRKRGAYARYKDLLDDRGFLQKWYDFENTRQTETLRRRCEDNEITLIS